MNIRKYIFFTVFLVITAVICTTQASSLSINNLTMINRIYKIICDVDSGRVQEMFGETDEAAEPEAEASTENAVKTEKKYIALTFDDGPHPQYTEKILRILSEKDTPATFFIVGSRAELHPAMVQRIRQINCEIGNHTHDHPNLLKISDGEFMNQMEKCSQAIYNITGEYPKLYRPPFGAIDKSKEQLIRDKMLKILWTVDSFDWKTADKDKVVKNVTNSVKNRSIILMHDFYSQSVEALPEIIDALKEQGYEFVTVSQLKELSDLPEKLDYFMD